MSERLEHLNTIIETLPDSPGVYQYLGQDGTIIYVGKAKKLKRRVSSYFNKVQAHPKVRALVRHIYDLKYIVVNTEEDALHLENNLIKQYQPHYNILLKDSKGYPWLCITKEDYPRVFATYKKNLHGEYYGPYSSRFQVSTLLEMIHETYKIRTCHQAMTWQGVKDHRYKICLEYHIKNCSGCCEGYDTREHYQSMISEIREICLGNIRSITDQLLKDIEQKAKELKFEEAYELKQKYDSLLKYQAKTIITTTRDLNCDIYSYTDDEKSAYVNVLNVTNGCIIQGLTQEYVKRLDETKEEIFSFAIIDLHHKLGSKNKHYLVPFDPDLNLSGVQLEIPKIGDKKKLLDLSIKNGRQYKLDKLKHAEKLNPEQRSIKLLKTLQDALKLDTLPQHIECFDNSNISGTSAVAACVVYKKAKPSRKDYRKYNIKTIEGSDDYGSMREVVKRRYTRMVNEKTVLPDLIITDGGKGQMSSVNQVVNLELHLNIPIAGLAKNDKHQTSELLYGHPPKALGLKPTDLLYKFLAGMQDEVHRFAITFHREKRKKAMTQSELDLIKGIGEKSKIALLRHFKTLNAVKSAQVYELGNVVGTTRATAIYNHFHPQ